MNTTDEFWETRWQNNETGWDIGSPSPALVEYMQQQSDKNLAILIPGCGSAYEAQWLLENGFTHVTLLDISPTACKQIEGRLSPYSGFKVICGNFFEHSGQYDIILEQTFYCAIDPSQRDAYVKKMNELLKPRGILAGLLFGVHFEKQGPPFGGNETEYRERFSPFFDINRLELCTNSIKPRMGNELIFEFQKK